VRFKIKIESVAIADRRTMGSIREGREDAPVIKPVWPVVKH